MDAASAPFLRWLVTLLVGWLAPWAVAAPIATLVITGGEAATPIAPHAEVLEDPSQALTIEQVRRIQTAWRAEPRQAFGFGFSKSAWWVRFRLVNSTDVAQPLVFDLGTSLQDQVDWHVVRPDGELVRTVRSGDGRPFDARGNDEPQLVFAHTLAPRETADLYLRLDTQDGLHAVVPLVVSTRAGHASRSKVATWGLGMYYGALLSLGLYNLFLYFSTRERAFGMYVLYVGSFLADVFVFRGLAFQYLWPNRPELSNPMFALTISASFACFGWFSLAYVPLPSDLRPRWVQVYRLLPWATIAGAVPSFFGHYALSIALVIGTSVLLVLLSYLGGAWLAWRGVREAGFVMAAFLMVFGGALVYYLQLAEVLPATDFVLWAVQIGSVAEVLLLAFGLADSMNKLKAQKLQAEREAREAQITLNARLEREVKMRTRELEEANCRLTSLAVTDELTGAYNRRHFNDICRETVNIEVRGRSMALCMVDIDHFKSFNDRYGHQGGDETLRLVAGALRNTLKRSGDNLFRLGGEEFGVLFSASSLQTASDFAERLRRAVQALGRPHAGSPMGIVTASFGVAWWSASDLLTMTPDAMYMAADAALYRAKSEGRDRVVAIAGTACRAGSPTLEPAPAAV